MSITILAVGALAAVAVATPLPGHHGHAESYVQLTNIANAAISHGGYEGYAGHLGGGHLAYHHEPIAHPKYAYKYGVEDAHTGDYKDAHEERDGDVVKGEYSLLQPDGTKRTVHYTADHHNGFNAVVSYSGHAIHPEQHPTLLHAAPIEAYHGHAYH